MESPRSNYTKLMVIIMPLASLSISNYNLMWTNAHRLFEV